MYRIAPVEFPLKVGCVLEWDVVLNSAVENGWCVDYTGRREDRQIARGTITKVEGEADYEIDILFPDGQTKKQLRIYVNKDLLGQPGNFRLAREQPEEPIAKKNSRFIRVIT